MYNYIIIYIYTFYNTGCLVSCQHLLLCRFGVSALFAMCWFPKSINDWREMGLPHSSHRVLPHGFLWGFPPTCWFFHKFPCQKCHFGACCRISRHIHSTIDPTSALCSFQGHIFAQKTLSWWLLDPNCFHPELNPTQKRILILLKKSGYGHF